MRRSNFQIIQSYLSYLKKSKTIYSIHSPFLFSLIESVRKDLKDVKFDVIEVQRKRLLRNQEEIRGVDYGAVKNSQPKKRIATIARRSLKSKKEALILTSIAKHLKCEHILELGTSLGITTSYLALNNQNSDIVSLEGNDEILKRALEVFENLSISNVRTLQGNIDQTLDEALDKKSTLDFVFIDANHRLNPTLDYFNRIQPFCNNDSVVIFDDIHWSIEMEEAWEKLKKDERVTVSVDLFHFGLVFFKKELSRQHFTIRV